MDSPANPALALPYEWTEQDILRLPDAEHGHFERKAGALFEGGKWRAQIARQVSAFANSSGGYLVIGVRDDGTVDGAPALHGDSRTPTRQWLEQVLPTLTQPSVMGCTVQEAKRSTPSIIPPGRCILVVGIPDSREAPHQSAVDRCYYRRTGSQTEPADHSCLERLRNRRAGPLLNIGLARVEAQDPRFSEGIYNVDFDLVFHIRNDGDRAALKHCVVLDNYPQATDRESSYSVERRNPYIGCLPGDPTVLPSITREARVAFDLRLRCEQVTVQLVQAELETLLPAEGCFVYRVAWETSPGQSVSTRVGEVLKADTLAMRLVSHHQAELAKWAH